MSTHNIYVQEKNISLNYPKYIESWSYETISPDTLERVRSSHSKRAIGVKVIEVSLYVYQSKNLAKLIMRFSSTS